MSPATRTAEFHAPATSGPIARTPEPTGPAPGGAVDRPWWKVVPYDRSALGWFVLAFIAMTAIWTAAGLAYVEWIEPSAIGEEEEAFSLYLEDARTPARDDLAVAGSRPSDIPVKIGLVAALAIALPLLWRRWHEWAFLTAALLLEVSVYGLSSYLVGRPRPPVERLASAPTESWPSGHVAAAVVAYFGLAMIVSWNTKRRGFEIGAWIAATLVVIAMIVSRLYLGMHYISDVVAGAALGALSLWVARELLYRSAPADGDPATTRPAWLNAEARSIGST